jgi:2-polyprenyl-3-methyl-5-hydroxy-6-metoxy-1,4-benzoquinol methylase
MISMKHYNTLSKTEEDVRQINRLVDLKNKSVLEIGCGTGRITFPLAERAGEIVAIDIDENATKEALKRNQNENVKFLAENIETTQLGKKFDAILSTWLRCVYLNACIPVLVQERLLCRV